MIRVPLRDPNERLDAKSIGSLPRVLADPEERKVCRELFAQCHRVGLRRVGDVHAFLEGLGPVERKGLLNKIRRHLGMKTTEELRMEAQQRRGSVPDVPLCPACGRMPVDPLTGIPQALHVKRWWCPEHRHLSQPGDMAPRELGLKIMPGGAIVEVNPDEAAREQAEAELRRRRHEEEMRRRRLVVERSEAEQAARDEAFRSELPPGIPG